MASDSLFRPSLLLAAFCLVVPGIRGDEPVMTDGDKSAPAKSPDKKPEQDRQDPRKGRPEGDEREREQRDTMEHMRRLLMMTDAQIGRMRATLVSVEKIPVERRDELRKQLEILRKATPAERDAFLKDLRDKYGLFDDQPRRREGGKKPGDNGRINILEKHFSTMTPEAADAERKRFIAMTREEKVAYIKQLREKYGIPEEQPRQDDKKKPDGRTAKAPASPPPAAPTPPPGDPFGA